MPGSAPVVATLYIYFSMPGSAPVDILQYEEPQQWSLVPIFLNAWNCTSGRCPIFFNAAGTALMVGALYSSMPGTVPVVAALYFSMPGITPVDILRFFMQEQHQWSVLFYIL